MRKIQLTPASVSPRLGSIPSRWSRRRIARSCLAAHRRIRRIVRYGDRWHLFMTVKLPGRSAIEYCTFKRFEDADASPRTLLPISDSDYFCAPQVFSLNRTRSGTSSIRWEFQIRRRCGSPIQPRTTSQIPCPGRERNRCSMVGQVIPDRGWPRLLDHLRSGTSLSVFHQPEWKNVANVDKLNDFPRGFDHWRGGAECRDL